MPRCRQGASAQDIATRDGGGFTADEMLRKAVAAGAKEAREPMEYEFMYGRSFEDLDGHIWEVFWMNPSAINQANAQNQ
jgi:predicted lactoylglutathione lyase